MVTLQASHPHMERRQKMERVIDGIVVYIVGLRGAEMRAYEGESVCVGGGR